MRFDNDQRAEWRALQARAKAHAKWGGKTVANGFRRVTIVTRSVVYEGACLDPNDATENSKKGLHRVVLTRDRKGNPATEAWVYPRPTRKQKKAARRTR